MDAFPPNECVLLLSLPQGVHSGQRAEALHSVGAAGHLLNEGVREGGATWGLLDTHQPSCLPTAPQFGNECDSGEQEEL